MRKKLKIRIAITLVLSFLTLTLNACAFGKKVLCKYDDVGCAYYVEDNFVDYKYSDFIEDDISNGEYKKPTPSIADYRIGGNPLDIDIPAYVNDRMNHALKNEIINNYEERILEYCKQVKDGVFKQRNSIIYFKDINSPQYIRLNETYATNMSYDDEVPSISFDILDENYVENDDSKKKMYLSDILTENLTIDGYMKIILSKGKSNKKFYRDEESLIEN